MTASNGTVAVLVRCFPKLSETFILGEIASLVESGVEVQIISLKRPTDALQQPDAELFSDRVTYVEPRVGLQGLLTTSRHAIRWLPRLPTLLRQLRQFGVGFGTFCRLYEICAEHEVDHIHAHYISEPALLADLLGQIRGHSFSVSAHAKDIYLTDKAAIRSRLENAAFVTTCTAHNKEFLSQQDGNKPSRVRLLYHGIDSDRFKPAGQTSGDQPPLLIAVGRYKRKKGFDLLINACAKLLSTGVPLRCEIVGYGDQEHELRRLIEDKGLADHVTLTEPVTHHDLVHILQNAAVCVLPCRQMEDGDRDGIPNAMLEAMSCEVPVVSTTVSGIPEVIQSGTNGLLVAPEDVQALVAAITRVLDDGQLRQHLAENGRRTVTDMFCWESNVAVLGQLLGAAMNSQSAQQSA